MELQVWSHASRIRIWSRDWVVWVSKPWSRWTCFWKNEEPLAWLWRHLSSISHLLLARWFYSSYSYYWCIREKNLSFHRLPHSISPWLFVSSQARLVFLVLSLPFPIYRRPRFLVSSSRSVNGLDSAAFSINATSDLILNNSLLVFSSDSFFLLLIAFFNNLIFAARYASGLLYPRKSSHAFFTVSSKPSFGNHELNSLKGGGR